MSRASRRVNAAQEVARTQPGESYLVEATPGFLLSVVGRPTAKQWVYHWKYAGKSITKARAVEIFAEDDKK